MHVKVARATGGISLTSDYAISLARLDDIPGILALQEPNLPDSGGSLSVRLTEDLFKRAVAVKSVVVGAFLYLCGLSLSVLSQYGHPRTFRFGTPMQNRRNSTRQRVLKGGSIAFGQCAAIDCAVRNMTRSGACLLVASPIGIQDQFELVLSADLSRRQCRVVWRSVDQVGVVFSHADAV